MAGVRVKQAFPFMSPEWDEFHDHARQSIESLRSGFKDDGKEVVASSGQRSPSRTVFALTPSSGDEIASGTTPTQRPPRETRSSTSPPAANSNHRFEPKPPTHFNTAKRHPPPQTEEFTAPTTGRVRPLTGNFAERRPLSPFQSHIRARKDETLPRFLRSVPLSGGQRQSDFPPFRSHCGARWAWLSVRGTGQCSHPTTIRLGRTLFKRSSMVES